MPKIALPPLLQRIYAFVFDFSAGENNRREVEDILLAVLAQSKNDDDFHTVLRRVVLAYEGNAAEGESRFYAFNRFMSRNRRLSDHDTGVRTRAEHLLADLPHIYGAKKPHTNKGNDVRFNPHYSVIPTKEKTNDV